MQIAAPGVARVRAHDVDEDDTSDEAADVREKRHPAL